MSLVLGACTTTPSLVPLWPADAAAEIELASTPFYPQDLYQCGPAALATLLSAAGSPITPEALTPEVYLPERTGSLQPELVAAARKRGFVVYPIRPELNDLIAQLHAGYPVLILQNQGLRSLPVWHYAVVVGANAATGQLVSRSGTSERALESIRRFQRRWALAENWGIVALLPGQLPHHPDWNRYLAAVADLEGAGSLEAAATAYQAALNAEPDLAGARFGLANVHYAKGRLEQASKAYQAVSADPHLGPLALNNLSNLWLDQGCLELAEAALNQAEAGSKDSTGPLASTRLRLQKLQLQQQPATEHPGCEIPAESAKPPLQNPAAAANSNQKGN